MNKTELKAKFKALTGGLSKTEKMPCFSFNLSALHCNIGSKLVSIKNSVCYGCYALKGRYIQYNLINKMKYKTNLIKGDQWVNAMIYLIENQGNTKDKNYFRWFDSGDIQEMEHLKKIVEIAQRLPKIKFWLPTKEFKLISDYRKNLGEFPSNLIVRLSAPMIGETLKTKHFLTSSVNGKGFNCPSSKQNSKCLDCRACWDFKIKNINYKYH